MFLRLRHYENFGYRSGPLSRPLDHVFGEILARIRTVLSGRSDEEIEYALESLDWMLGRASLNFLEQTPAGGRPDGAFVNRVHALRAWRSQIDLQDQAYFSNPSWAEYFAVLALAYVAEAVFVEAHTPKGSTPRSPILEVDPATLLQAIEAMDATCYAEELRRREELLKTVKADKEAVGIEIMRERGAKGGRIYASRFSGLKQKVIALDRQLYANRSARQSSKRLCEQLKEEIEATLTTEDPEATLAKWIGSARRASSE